MNGVIPSRGLRKKFLQKYGNPDGVWKTEYITISTLDPVSVSVDTIAAAVLDHNTAVSQVVIKSREKVERPAFDAYMAQVTAALKARGVK